MDSRPAAVVQAERQLQAKERKDRVEGRTGTSQGLNYQELLDAIKYQWRKIQITKGKPEPLEDRIRIWDLLDELARR